MLNKIIMKYGELKKIVSLSIEIPLKKKGKQKEENGLKRGETDVEKWFISNHKDIYMVGEPIGFKNKDCRCQCG